MGRVSTSGGQTGWRMDEIVRTSLERAGLWNEVKDRLTHS